ncbi:FAD-dependent thymidylate synthase [Desulforhopalus singaporensis]|uniref:Thymidylate synthase (FAD) n=1 Tax=Desulforhopalus singaporensis TaxID=91360 RepID=A0A1H0PEC0_9BACT|nr:FAD-dependent thymidylate synthase [Desulforhopalus singaporensis]SDP03035.1 thymidylate synthase (FAD) [Desulforhopalus singaporensis]
MKIVEPSFEIQDDLDNSSVTVRLEKCGRICYKSEDSITEDSALPFVTKIAAHGHNSVLEMAVVSFEVTCHADHVLELLSCQPKYLEVDRTDTGMIVTGSIRTFRELYKKHPYNQLVNDLVTGLAQKEPHLFKSVFDSHEALEVDPGLTIRKMSLEQVEALPAELKARHRYVGVLFVVNRAVTHEIVRHRPCSFLQESQRYCRYNQDKFDNQVTFIKPMFFAEGSEEYKLWQEAMEMTEKRYLKLLESSTPQAARTVLPNSCKTEIIVYCNLEEWTHIFSLRTTKAAEPSMREVMNPLAEEFKKRYPAIFV